MSDPVLRHARREGLFIGAFWLAATVFCCLTCYFLGYIRPGHPRGPGDLHFILGMPSWFFWGIFVPWLVCGVIMFVFAGWFMKEDDLGADHAAELESEIREGVGSDG